MYEVILYKRILPPLSCRPDIGRSEPLININVRSARVKSKLVHFFSHHYCNHCSSLILILRKSLRTRSLKILSIFSAPLGMSSRSRVFTIRVPATSANIGPGFDVVGLSLSLYLTLTVTISTASSDSSSSSTPAPPTLVYSGEGSDEVPLDAYKNLTTRVALYVLRCRGVSTFPQHLTIHAHNEIPFGRGLGSSGAAVIAGVLLGSELGDLSLSRERALDFALMVERHPDNVTAALVGGFVGSYLRELAPEAALAASVPLSEVLPEFPPDAGPDWGRDPPVPPPGIGHFVRFGWAKEIKAVAIIPRFELSTARAREVLPESYSRKDLVRLLWLFTFYPKDKFYSGTGLQFTASGGLDDRPRTITTRC